MSRVIKNSDITQPYDRDKLHDSIQSVCLSIHGYIGAAEQTAHKVCDHIDNWLNNHDEVTSHDIRLKAAEALAIYDSHSALLYRNHMEIG